MRSTLRWFNITRTVFKMLFKLAIVDLIILIVPVLGVVDVLLNPRG
jgi:hypothetical protein